MDIIKKWYEISCNYHLLTDSHSINQNDNSFEENPHDQSIFSLLCKKYGIDILPDRTTEKYNLSIPILKTYRKSYFNYLF